MIEFVFESTFSIGVEESLLFSSSLKGRILILTLTRSILIFVGIDIDELCFGEEEKPFNCFFFLFLIKNDILNIKLNLKM